MLVCVSFSFLFDVVLLLLFGLYIVFFILLCFLALEAPRVRLVFISNIFISNISYLPGEFLNRFQLHLRYVSVSESERQHVMSHSVGACFGLLRRYLYSLVFLILF